MANLNVPFASVAQRLAHDLPYSRPSTPAHQGPIQVGWIGLGAMGYLMARNLANHRAAHLDHQPPLLVWNRSKNKSEKLLQELGESKVAIAQTAVDVAIRCDIIISSLSGDAVVKSVFKENVAALQAQPPTKPKIFVETSTIYPSVAGGLDTLVSSIPNCHLVTSPVLGPPTLADKAALLIALSGDYRSKKEVAYTLVPAIGRRVIDCGGNIEKAPTYKLICNSLILGSIELIAEAYTIAEKSGIGQELVYEYIKDLIPAPVWLGYGDKMLHNKFDGSVGFAIDGGVKDAGHMRRLATEHNSPMPTVDVAHNNLLTARALHTAQARTGSTSFPVLDWAALIAGSRVAAGLDAFDAGKESVVPEAE